MSCPTPSGVKTELNANQPHNSLLPLYLWRTLDTVTHTYWHITLDPELPFLYFIISWVCLTSNLLFFYKMSIPAFRTLILVVSNRKAVMGIVYSSLCIMHEAWIFFPTLTLRRYYWLTKTWSLIRGIVILIKRSIFCVHFCRLRRYWTLSPLLTVNMYFRFYILFDIW